MNEKALRDPKAYMGALCRWWNRTGFDAKGKAERRKLAKHILMQNWHDYRNRGKGNKAWKRAERINRELDAITVDPFAIALSCL